MTGLFGIYRLTLISLWRERWPWLVMPLLALGFFVSRLLASFTIGRDAVVTVDLGLVLLNLVTLLCTLYMAQINWARELEGPSAAFFLTRPIGRHAYVLGRFLGMATVSAFLVFGGALVLVATGLLLGVAPNWQVIPAAYGIWLSMLVVLSFASMAVHLSSPLLGLLVTVLFYVATLLADAAVEFFESRQMMAQRLGVVDPKAGFYRFIARFMTLFVPQLNRLNLKELVIVDGVAKIPAIPYFHLTCYALTFTAVFLAWGLYLMDKREFP